MEKSDLKRFKIVAGTDRPFENVGKFYELEPILLHLLKMSMNIISTSLASLIKQVLERQT